MAWAAWAAPLDLGQIHPNMSFYWIENADPVSIRKGTVLSLIVVDTKYEKSETVEYTVVGDGHCLGASDSPSGVGTTMLRVSRFPATSSWLRILDCSGPLYCTCSKQHSDRCSLGFSLFGCWLLQFTDVCLQMVENGGHGLHQDILFDPNLVHRGLLHHYYALLWEQVRTYDSSSSTMLTSASSVVGCRCFTVKALCGLSSCVRY